VTRGFWQHVVQRATKATVFAFRASGSPHRLAFAKVGGKV